jgi:hypothetical protein
MIDDLVFVKDTAKMFPHIKQGLAKHCPEEKACYCKS